jgi:hypothetical protein
MQQSCVIYATLGEGTLLLSRHSSEYNLLRLGTLRSMATILFCLGNLRSMATIFVYGRHSTECNLVLSRHSTEKGYYPKDFGSVHGEDLAYVFGMPLGTVHQYSYISIKNSAFCYRYISLYWMYSSLYPAFLAKVVFI